MVEVLDPLRQLHVTVVVAHALVVEAIAAPLIGLLGGDASLAERLFGKGAVVLVGVLSPAHTENGDPIGQLLVDKQLVERRDQLAASKVSHATEDHEQMGLDSAGHCNAISIVAVNLGRSDGPASPSHTIATGLPRSLSAAWSPNDWAAISPAKV